MIGRTNAGGGGGNPNKSAVLTVYTTYDYGSALSVTGTGFSKSIPWGQAADGYAASVTIKKFGTYTISCGGDSRTIDINRFGAFEYYLKTEVDFYSYGKINTDVVGDFDVAKSGSGTAVKEAQSLYMTAPYSGANRGGFYTTLSIDMSQFESINLLGDDTATGSSAVHTCRLYLSTSTSYTNAVQDVNLTGTGKTVSLTDLPSRNLYIIVDCNSSTNHLASFRVHRIWGVRKANGAIPRMAEVQMALASVTADRDGLVNDMGALIDEIYQEDLEVIG